MGEKKRKKKGLKKILLLAVAILIAAAIGVYFFLKYQSYDYIEITESYENNTTDNANYQYCLGGILRYSRDGIALLSTEGKVVWNQSCQMSTPVVEQYGDSVAVGDKGGTSILVFQENGLKGEIRTTRPIEKFAVSSQGVVSAILKDDERPLVICYDAKGKILVEQKVSLNTMGYPVDVAISEDGKTLLVSYLYTQGGGITTNVAYYYLDGMESENKDHLVLQESLPNTVVPVTAFLKKEISLVVADNALIYYEGLTSPKECARVELKNEIQSIAYDEELIAVVVKNEGDADYKLEIYDYKGKQQVSVDVEKEYESMKVIDDQIIMHDGQMCSIYLKNGVHKFEGKADENIVEIFPVRGLNKYMMINASGFHEIQLAK